jgi:hypothetical protein
MTGIYKRSVGVVLVVGFAVYGVGGFLVRSRVSHDAGGGVLVAVRCVLDQGLLGEFKALGLASSGLIHGSALFAPAGGAIDAGFGRRVLVHA